jgi:choline kinase
MSQVSKAIIFAAGLCSRLGPHTKDLPKTLLKVGELTILDRMIIGLDKVGIKDISIVVGYASTRLRSYVLTTSSTLVQNRIKFDFIENTNLDIGNIYSFWLARNKMIEDFILLNSDVVFHYGILESLIRESSGISALLIDDSKTLGAEEMKVKIKDGGRIIKDITKKLDPKTANGEYIGITKISHDDVSKILEKVDQLLSEKKFPLYYEDAFRLVANESELLSGCSTRGLPWTEIDTVEDMNYARNTVLPRIEEAHASATH